MTIAPARQAAVLLAVLALGACAVRQGPAPVVDRAPASAGLAKPGPAKPVPPHITASSGDYYVVKKGDTLYSIALEHGADYREVAQWNGLDDPTRIQVGQQLRVKPPPARPTVQVGTARVDSRLESRPLETSPRQEPKLTAREEPKAPPREEPKAAPREEPKLAAGEIQFVWPARGKVIGGFSEPRSKGIDIDGKPGDPIVAAAAGRVTYTGTGIAGLGKLVVIKHDSGFITVYAHNREILVKEQQSVTRGQKIAELGSTDADRPKLHFQIRKGSAAVDPMRYLPGS
jgi:lipoprotein NlpD